MPRRPTVFVRKPEQLLSCLVYGCSQQFCTQGGRTKHLRSKHDDTELCREESPIAPNLPQSRTRMAGLSPLDADVAMLRWSPLDVGMPDLSRPVSPDLGFPDGINVSPPPFHDGDVEMLDQPPPPASQSEPEANDDPNTPKSVPSTKYHPSMNGNFSYAFFKPLPLKIISQLYRAKKMGHP